MERLKYVKYPRLPAEFPSYAQALRDHVLPGFIPEQPPFTRDVTVMTQGSCFAQNVHRAMKNAGIKCLYNEVLEACNTPKANRLLFEYALRGKPFAAENHALAFDPAVLSNLREVLPHVRAVIYTVGLIYEPHLDGQYAFNWPPSALPRVEWRASTVSENVEHLQEIVTMLREVNPTLTIVFTLSPIPIAATESGISPIVADCISKSTLRTALNELLAQNIPNVAYWPAFEAIRWLGSHIGPTFGAEGEDHRHPGPSYIQAIVNAFIDAYFQPLPAAS